MGEERLGVRIVQSRLREREREREVGDRWSSTTSSAFSLLVPPAGVDLLPVKM